MSFSHIVAHQALGQIDRVFKPMQRFMGFGIDTLIPSEVPSVESVMELSLKGWIPEHLMELYSRIRGVAINVTGQPNEFGNVTGDWTGIQNLWNQVYFASQDMPTLVEQLKISNRQLYDDQALDFRLKRLGFYETTLRGQVANLRYEIPSSADLVRFSVRHVFEPDLIAKLEMNAEFRPILDLWHRFQGLNYPIFTGPFETQIGQFEGQLGLVPGTFSKSYAAAGLEDPTWAQAFWWSHWVQISPTQAYEMFFRLRPGRDRKFDPPFARNLDFTFEDLALSLRANDYTPRNRPFLAAIAYRIPGIRFIRELRANDVYTFNDLVEWAHRQGYSDKDSLDIATNIERTVQKKAEAKISCKGCAQAIRYYETGIIDRDGMIALFQQFGLAINEAQQEADIADLDLQNKRAVQVVATLRRRYLSGDQNRLQIEATLLGYGIVATRVNEYLDDWDLELSTERRQISAAKAINYACKGLIPLVDLQRRLANLRYDPDDIAAMTAEAQYCAAQLAARAAAAQQRLQRQQVSDLKRAQREAAAVIVQARRALSSHGSPKELRNWFCEGHIGEDQVYGRLRFLGWPDVDITRLLDDCKSGRKPTVPGPGTIGPQGPFGTPPP